MCKGNLQHIGSNMSNGMPNHARCRACINEAWVRRVRTFYEREHVRDTSSPASSCAHVDAWRIIKNHAWRIRGTGVCAKSLSNMLLEKARTLSIPPRRLAKRAMLPPKD